MRAAPRRLMHGLAYARERRCFDFIDNAKALTDYFAVTTNR
jgi:hypothetical protein